MGREEHRSSGGQAHECTHAGWGPRALSVEGLAAAPAPTCGRMVMSVEESVVPAIV